MLIKDPPVQITENLWMFGTNQYPLFLFKGHTIFEGGIGAMGRLMSEQMERLGVPRDSVKQVVIPHGHPDHAMAVPSLREIFPDITVLASEIAAATLSAEKAISFFRDVDAQLNRSLMKAGLITEAHCPPPLTEKQIPVDTILKEGDTLSIDGSEFHVLHTPGHSDCSLSFHEPTEGILFISDASGYYMPEFDCWWVNYFTGYESYIKSMRRLAALEAEILCLGHLGAIRGAEDVGASGRDPRGRRREDLFRPGHRRHRAMPPPHHRRGQAGQHRPPNRRTARQRSLPEDTVDAPGIHPEELRPAGQTVVKTRGHNAG